VALLAPAEADVGSCVRGALPGALGERERAVLAVLVEHHGRVVDRSSLRHRAGLGDLSPRRCDAVLVRVRAALGGDAIVTVRRRGWMLRTEAIALAAAIVASIPG
jgi:DNA-binding response OmpR family regulator